MKMLTLAVLLTITAPAWGNAALDAAGTIPTMDGDRMAEFEARVRALAPVVKAYAIMAPQCRVSVSVYGPEGLAKHACDKALDLAEEADQMVADFRSVDEWVADHAWEEVTNEIYRMRERAVKDYNKATNEMHVVLALIK